MTDFKIDCSLYYLKSIFEAIEFKNGPFKGSDSDKIYF